MIVGLNSLALSNSNTSYVAINLTVFVVVVMYASYSNTSYVAINLHHQATFQEPRKPIQIHRMLLLIELVDTTVISEVKNSNTSYVAINQ